MPSVPAAAHDALPAGYSLRPLLPADYHNGLMDCLGQLTRVGCVSEPQFHAQLAYMHRHPDIFHVRVITDPRGRVVACGTLLVEQKFIHHCGAAGHIEDIVVDAAQRGRHLGCLLLAHLQLLARELGCYKVILDCEPDRVEFYEKCGFARKGVQMARYF